MGKKRAHGLVNADAARPRLTDHALVRVLERGGFDVETVRSAIEEALSAAHGAAVALGGFDHIITVDGLSFVVRGGNVTTVIDAPEPGHRAHALVAPQG